MSPCSAPASFNPCLLMVDMSVWATSPLGVVVRHLICGFYLFIFSSWLCCPLRFQNSPDSPGERVSWCLETSLLWFPPRDGSPFLTLLSLFLSFIFCPISFQRQRAAFLVAWCPLPAFRSCSVEFAQCSNDLWMNLWGRKWPPHPISPPS